MDGKKESEVREGGREEGRGRREGWKEGKRSKRGEGGRYGVRSV